MGQARRQKCQIRSFGGNMGDDLQKLLAIVL
jgi:hypothetical protein